MFFFKVQQGLFFWLRYLFKSEFVSTTFSRSFHIKILEKAIFVFGDTFLIISFARFKTFQPFFTLLMIKQSGFPFTKHSSIPFGKEFLENFVLLTLSLDLRSPFFILIHALNDSRCFVKNSIMAFFEFNSLSKDSHPFFPNYFHKCAITCILKARIRFGIDNRIFQ